MNSPLVSIVITTFNRRELVQKAIRSALAQTYTNFDLHVVDDGSTDGTGETIKYHFGEKERFFYCRHEVSHGLSAARNTGISRSLGEYLAFLDDDDEWKPDSLDKRVGASEALGLEPREKLGVVYSGCEVRIPHEKQVNFNMPAIDGDIAACIRTHDLSTIPSTGLFSRKALEQINGFDETLVSSVDHDLWMSLANHGFHALAVHEALTVTYIRKNSKSMVSDTMPRIQGVEQYLKKWRPTFQRWHGEEGAERYIRSYRTRVLGKLTAQKLSDGKITEAVKLTRHLLRKNGWALNEHFKVTLMFIHNIARKIVPLPLLRLYRGRGG